MAVSLLSHEVSDLCIAKPAVRSLPLSSTVFEALSALRRCSDGYLCLVETDRSLPEKKAVAGKVSVADVLCWLCSCEKNLVDPAGSLSNPVSVILYKDTGAVAGGGGGADLIRRVEPHASVLTAVDAILDGASTLVVPLRFSGGRRKHHSSVSATSSAEFCWLTPEDLVRHFLGSIALFSHTATLPISSLGLIRPPTLSIRPQTPAISAVPLLRQAISDGTAVAVVSGDGLLLGEISPSLLSFVDESTAAAIASLSVGELIAYLDFHDSPPEPFVQIIKSRLREKGLNAMADLLEDELDAPLSPVKLLSGSSSASSSDEEPGRPQTWQRRLRSGGYHGRRSAAEVVVCGPGSSIVAIMVQAIAHRVSYLWVVEEGDSGDSGRLVGIVTFRDLLKVFREQSR